MTKPNNTHDRTDRRKVAIIGCGPTGLTAASLLGKAGHDVIVISLAGALRPAAPLTHRRRDRAAGAIRRRHRPRAPRCLVARPVRLL
ncbi:MAG: FAD-dependent monooxygenase [Rhodobacteraceae bacterium]|nr:FAD-dependent monooxygenase [Paracoccaceae bacterium]MCB1402252.1 FAD-dependent monooxygenase [Paracoccaceae bacterium]